MSNIVSVHRVGEPSFFDRTGMVNLGKVTEHRSTGTEYYYYYCKPENLDAATAEFEKEQARAKKNNERFMNS